MQSQSEEDMAHVARRKVLEQIPELLENVLVHLPLKVLFQVQRVSRQFRDTVQQSPSIQTKLWLRPSIRKSKQQWELTRFQSPPPKHNFSRHDTTQPQNTIHLYTPAVLHPLVGTALKREYYADHYHKTTSPPTASRKHIKIREFLNSINPTNPASPPSCSTASWKSMFLTDPPCTHAQLFVTWDHDPQRLGLLHSPLVVDSGIKLGDVASLMAEAREDIEQSLKGSPVEGAEERRKIAEDAMMEDAEIFIFGSVFPTEDEWKAMAKDGKC